MQANAVQTVLWAFFSFLFFNGGWVEEKGVRGAISSSQEGRVCFSYIRYVFNFNECTGPLQAKLQ